MGAKKKQYQIKITDLHPTGFEPVMSQNEKRIMSPLPSTARPRMHIWS